MAIVHISVTEPARGFDLIAQVRAGAEIAIKDGSEVVAVLHAPSPQRRTIAECIAMLPEDSAARIDEDFPRDVHRAVTAANFFERRAGNATGEGLLAYLENAPDSPSEMEENPRRV